MFGTHDGLAAWRRTVRCGATRSAAASPLRGPGAAGDAPPHELWSWDITTRLGPAKWTDFYRYVILDVFSRYAVGWMGAPCERASLAERLIETTCTRQGIVPGHRTIHADRGSSMTSKPVARLLADLGVTTTHARPHVSNDNPYSERPCKTLTYRPACPARFGSMGHARTLSGELLQWYHHAHHHAGLGLLTPSDVHDGLAEAKIAQRARVLTLAYAAPPERVLRHAPTPPALPQAVWINKPTSARGDRASGVILGAPTEIDAQHSPRIDDLGV